MNKAVLYLHGKGGNAAEAEHYRPLFPGMDMVGLDYHGATPWDTRDEIRAAYAAAYQTHEAVMLIANSIGAYFAMHALADMDVERAFLISPIVDMERLITDMMTWAHVSEEELRERQEIPTEFGETLSWRYLCYVREHPISWHTPTDILYAGQDNLTSRETITRFAERTGASLTVMETGEHWFHTPEQLAFLDRWMVDAAAHPAQGRRR